MKPFPLYNTPNMYYPVRATAAWMDTLKSDNLVRGFQRLTRTGTSLEAGIKPGP